MADQLQPAGTFRPSTRLAELAADLVERWGIAEQVGPDWENHLRRHASRQRVDIRCPQGHLVARYGLTPPHLRGGVELLKRGPLVRHHITNVWLTISRVTWWCSRCGYLRPTTREALQKAVERAVAARRTTVVLGLDL